jgi:predicted O-methyltransferase YrrM
MFFHGLVEHPERTNNRNTKALVRKIAAYQQFLKEQEKYETQFLSVGDGIALTRKKAA